MEEALLTQDNVFYVQENGADADWLSQYYAEKNVKISLELTEDFAEEFEIYRIVPVTGGE